MSGPHCHCPTRPAPGELCPRCGGVGARVPLVDAARRATRKAREASQWIVQGDDLVRAAGTAVDAFHDFAMTIEVDRDELRQGFWEFHELHADHFEGIPDWILFELWRSGAVWAYWHNRICDAVLVCSDPPIETFRCDSSGLGADPPVPTPVGTGSA